MATIAAEGQTLADGTEQTVATITGAGVYQVNINMINGGSGKTLVMRGKQKVLAAGSLQTTFEETFTGTVVVPDGILAFTPMICPEGMTLTLEQTAGTLVNWAWNVIKLMEVTVESSGSPTITTSVATLGSIITDNKVLALITDHKNQPASTATTLRMITKVRTGTIDTPVAILVTPTGVLTAPDIIQQSIPLVAPFHGEFAASRSGGSDYTVEFAVCSLSVIGT